MKIFTNNRTFQKRIILLFITILCFLISGCERKNEYYSGETNYEYDDQNFFHASHSIAKARDGYYFVQDDILKFFPKDSSKVIPVCSQINCEHIDESCDAYLKFLAHNGIWYYDNQIYVMQYDINEYTYYLSSITLDGSKREKVCDLLKLEISGEEDGYVFGGDIYDMVIHRGYAYYVISDDTISSELRRVELKRGAKPEVIYTGEGENASIVEVKGFENHIYFQMHTFRMLDSTTLEILNANMYDYDILTGELSICIEGSRFDYIPMSDKIYFFNDNGLNRFTFSNSQTELVYETSHSYALSYDGKYFYFDNQFKAITEKEPRCISVFDESFKLIDQIDLNPSYWICFFGDENYLFADNGSEGGDWMDVFDKSQIGTGRHEWITLD